MINDQSRKFALFLSDLLDRFIEVEGYGNVIDPIRLKIDLMERALEILRIEQKYPKNNVSMEEFIQSHFTSRDDKMVLFPPDKLEISGSGTPPIRLQPKLLLFLLLHHRSSFRVYDIITNFVEKIWVQLEVLDFKRTETGATRCFTNTRFAANTLREYGLLKFTRKEAYKTWVLSLPGFLVASRVLQERNWNLTKIDKSHAFDLHPDIFSAWKGLETYDQFVNQLESVCASNVDVFKTFDDFLKTAYRQLKQYFQILQNNKLSQKERRKESLLCLGLLEAEPKIDNFYKEFSICLKIEDMINTLVNIREGK